MALGGDIRATRGGIGIGAYATIPTIRGGVMVGVHLGITTTTIRTPCICPDTILRTMAVDKSLRSAVRA